jgi:hypothetical protein
MISIQVKRNIAIEYNNFLNHLFLDKDIMELPKLEPSRPP